MMQTDLPANSETRADTDIAIMRKVTGGLAAPHVALSGVRISFVIESL